MIDLDIYDMDLSDYLNAIEAFNFPLVPFKTKSGGLHLYIFFKEFVSVKPVVEILKKLAAILALDTLTKNVKNEIVEIFPKQINLTKNTVGNWINLPYYDHENTKQFLIQKNKPLSLSDALMFIKHKVTTIDAANNFMKSLSFADATPCLQNIYILNSIKENAGRNEYLFSFGNYLKRKDENFFEQNLFDINSRLKVPLAKNELENTILKSLRKKDYNYKCTQSPLINFCNKSICKKKEYGVGKEGGYFSELEYGKLYQYKASEPYYEWEVKIQGEKEFKKLRFQTENEIIKQDAFLKLCFRELHRDRKSVV